MPLRPHFNSSEQPFAVETKCYYINQSASIQSIVHILISFNAMHLVVYLNYKELLYRGSYMSAHVLLNLLNELEKRDKIRGLPSILSLFRNEFNKFNNTRARMLDSIYHVT